MRALLLILPLLASGAAAQSDPAQPAWDIRAHCEAQNRVLATESAFLLRACMDQEDRAETMVQRGWDTLAPAIRRTCLSQQRVLRMASYFLLNACIEQELGATRDIEQRSSRR